MHRFQRRQTTLLLLLLCAAVLAKQIGLISWPIHWVHYCSSTIPLELRYQLTTTTAPPQALHRKITVSCTLSPFSRSLITPSGMVTPLPLTITVHSLFSFFSFLPSFMFCSQVCLRFLNMHFFLSDTHSLGVHVAAAAVSVSLLLLACTTIVRLSVCVCVGVAVCWCLVADFGGDHQHLDKGGEGMRNGDRQTAHEENTSLVVNRNAMAAMQWWQQSITTSAQSSRSSQHL